MDIRTATGPGLAAISEGFAKVRSSLPEDLVGRAEESPLGKQVHALVEALAGEARQVEAGAESLAERAVEVTKAESAATVAAVKEAAMSESRPGGRMLKAALGVLLIGAAAGGGYYVWSKRRAAANAHLSGEGAWGSAPASAEPFQAGMADTQSPDVVDEEFAAEVDAEAAQFAEELVDSVEMAAPKAPEPPGGSAEAAERFEEGMAATQGPETVDEQFAAEIDAAADDLADSIVKSVEEPNS